MEGSWRFEIDGLGMRRQRCISAWHSRGDSLRSGVAVQRGRRSRLNNGRERENGRSKGAGDLKKAVWGCRAPTGIIIRSEYSRKKKSFIYAT